MKLKLIFMLITLSILLCACGSEYTIPSNVSSRTYDCDYHTLSLKTKITTKIDNEEIAITGRLFTFITDPLKMTDSKGNVIASADDSYNIISQDDHAILVGNQVEIIVKGNFEFFGESYDLYNKNGTKVGYAEFGEFGCSGEIVDTNKNLIAKFSSPPLFNDYSVTIYDNNICSDKAILLIVASYVSDYHYDKNNN